MKEMYSVICRYQWKRKRTCGGTRHDTCNTKGYAISQRPILLAIISYLQFTPRKSLTPSSHLALLFCPFTGWSYRGSPHGSSSWWQGHCGSRREGQGEEVSALLIQVDFILWSSAWSQV